MNATEPISEVARGLTAAIRDYFNKQCFTAPERDPLLALVNSALAEREKEIAFLKSSACEAAWCERWKNLCSERDQLRAQRDAAREALMFAIDQMFLMNGGCYPLPHQTRKYEAFNKVRDAIEQLTKAKT